MDNLLESLINDLHNTSKKDLIEELNKYEIDYSVSPENKVIFNPILLMTHKCFEENKIWKEEQLKKVKNKNDRRDLNGKK